QDAPPALRSPARLLPGPTPAAGDRPGLRLPPGHAAQPGSRVPRPLPPGSGSPLFAEPRRGRPRGHGASVPPAQPEPAAVADRRQLALHPGRRLRTRVAGVFLFLPLLARLDFDALVRHAGYPGSRMVPAPAALLSLLA